LCLSHPLPSFPGAHRTPLRRLTFFSVFCSSPDRSRSRSTNRYSSKRCHLKLADFQVLWLHLQDLNRALLGRRRLITATTTDTDTPDTSSTWGIRRRRRRRRSSSSSGGRGGGDFLRVVQLHLHPLVHHPRHRSFLSVEVGTSPKPHQPHALTNQCHLW
jgi:hypothetical protein